MDVLNNIFVCGLFGGFAAHKLYNYLYPPESLITKITNRIKNIVLNSNDEEEISKFKKFDTELHTYNNFIKDMINNLTVTTGSLYVNELQNYFNYFSKVNFSNNTKIIDEEILHDDINNISKVISSFISDLMHKLEYISGSTKLKEIKLDLENYIQEFN